MCDVTIRMYCYKIFLGYKVILVLPPKLSLKTHSRTHSRACFNNHVTSYVTYKIAKWPTA